MLSLEFEDDEDLALLDETVSYLSFLAGHHSLKIFRSRRQSTGVLLECIHGKPIQQDGKLVHFLIIEIMSFILSLVFQSGC